MLKSKVNGILINRPMSLSSSGSFKDSKTVFDYYRIDVEDTDGATEWITSLGPTYNDIDIFVSIF